jgi:hypothetical protein
MAFLGGKSTIDENVYKYLHDKRIGKRGSGMKCT